MLSVRARSLINWIGLATPLGLAIAKLGQAHLGPGPHNLRIATSWRGSWPRAIAFTVGDVIITKLSVSDLDERPELLAHEAQHSDQWACWFGLPFLPAYAAASLWSLFRTGDPASRNGFERRANLLAGGYRERPIRRGL